LKASLVKVYFILAEEKISRIGQSLSVAGGFLLDRFALICYINKDLITENR